jgi:hypothetical protein
MNNAFLKIDKLCEIVEPFSQRTLHPMAINDPNVQCTR